MSEGSKIKIILMTLSCLTYANILALTINPQNEIQYLQYYIAMICGCLTIGFIWSITINCLTETRDTKI